MARFTHEKSHGDSSTTSSTSVSTRPTCSHCLADEIAILSVGPDLRTVTVRCDKCGCEAVLVVSDDELSHF